MSFRKEARSEVRSHRAKCRTPELAAVKMGDPQREHLRPVLPKAAARLFFPLLALVLAGCWLFEDSSPPVCQMLQPTDSSLVSGIVLVRAEATDTSGVSEVEFFVDGSRIGTDATRPYEVEWDTRNLENQSWHQLFCRAEDFSGNKGYSDTVNVQVSVGSEQDIFHGRFSLQSGYYWPVQFSAELGDTVAGEFRLSGPGVLSRFIWLDAGNYREFQAGRSYSAILEEVNRAEFTVRAGVTKSDSFYLVFLNTSGSQITCWVRFSLEQRQ